MAKKKKQKWGVGDVFVVELQDGRPVPAQVIGREAEVLNSVSCAFFDIDCQSRDDCASLKNLPSDKAFSILFVTRELLDEGVWAVVSRLPVTIHKATFPYEDLRNSGFVGAKVIGSGIVNEFLNAFWALVPWDDWKDPEYLDNLLTNPEKKPTRLKYK